MRPGGVRGGGGRMKMPFTSSVHPPSTCHKCWLLTAHLEPSSTRLPSAASPQPHLPCMGDLFLQTQLKQHQIYVENIQISCGMWTSSNERSRNSKILQSPNLANLSERILCYDTQLPSVRLRYSDLRIWTNQLPDNL